MRFQWICFLIAAIFVLDASCFLVLTPLSVRDKRGAFKAAAFGATAGGILAGPSGGVAGGTMGTIAENRWRHRNDEPDGVEDSATA
ncbi:hypothetical protein RvY_01287 [Ramazzottius varieornatus]|uniref:Major facilitator superfamily (MFS) profile domain-containing protein n=1 Tax=Ramazzottius varieornatus TaxID=947166 RepID=A0A1D1UFR8_RAMVA|nr:hypothetical protein RvY_01287 [Ramazzottius varieornatus]